MVRGGRGQGGGTRFSAVHKTAPSGREKQLEAGGLSPATGTLPHPFPVAPAPVLGSCWLW